MRGFFVFVFFLILPVMFPFPPSRLGFYVNFNMKIKNWKDDVFTQLLLRIIQFFDQN